jgi:hypothetical protein
MDSALRVYKHTDRDGAWFVADPISGTILIDNCTSLDAAIQARQRLIAGVQSAVRRNARPEEADRL